MSYMRDAAPFAMARRAPPEWTDVQRSILRLLEYLFVLAVLVICLNGWRTIFVKVSDSPSSLTDANFGFQVISGTLYLVAAAFLLAHAPRFVRLCRGNWPLLLLLAVVVVSCVWSLYPLVSFRRATALLLTTGFGAYLAMRFSPKGALKLVAWACCIAALASLVLVVVDPRVAIHQAGDIHEGAWRGIFGHKNTMGRSMAFGVVTLAAVAFVVRPAARLAAIVGALLCGALLAMSLSRTGWVVAFFVVMAVPLFLILQPSRFSRGIRMFATGLGALAALILIVLGYHYGLALMGRDETLSGRTRLWELAINSGMKHFALGAGYRAYWTEAGSMDVAAATSIGGDNLGNGHNGYLDTWLELGLLGFAAFLLVLVTAARRITRSLTSSSDPTVIWLAMILSYMTIYAWTEQILIQQSEITWVMLVAALFWLTPNRSRVRVARPVAPNAAALSVPKAARRHVGAGSFEAAPTPVRLPKPYTSQHDEPN